MALHADVPARVVLDAGPLIGAFNSRDAHHEESARGLRRLVDGHVRILIPVPIVFEVFKWLSYNVNPGAARIALIHIRLSFELVDVTQDMLADLAAMVDGMPRWSGSLEDAVVAYIGGDMGAPVWTFNYRDLGAFPNLQFWTPG
jgi:predicted nucleic acid-binding protein